MINFATVHYMGVDNVRPTISVVGLSGALSFPILGMLIGLIRDLTNSYSMSMCAVLALELLNVAMWLFMPVAQVWDARREQQGAMM